MARIVYSCCGEGRGHSSRTLTLVRRMQALGHEVRVLASHAAFAALLPLLPEVREIPGLILIYERNRVRIRKTLGRNAITWSRKEEAVAPIAELLREFQPDLAITDFEPFLPIAAKRAGVPFISIDHQHVIPGLKLPVPPRYWPHFAATRAIIRLTHSGEAANLVTSFFHPERPHSPEYHYFGPILRDEIVRLRSSRNGHVLVYQTSASFQALPDILKTLPFEFRLYAFNREGRDGNCTFKPRGHPDFYSDLASCSWVLTNGGYTLISEALYLGKPVLSIPISGQFEQWINAHYLHRLGYGDTCERAQLNARFIERFAARKDEFGSAIAGGNFDGTDAILAKALSFLPQNSRSPADQILLSGKA